MSGRYTMTRDKVTIEHHFGARFISGHFEHYKATYNAAPSQHLPIIRTYAPDKIELATWGFWPEGWKRSKKLRPLFNARLETGAEKPMFASSCNGRHCMALADGYYEWRVTAGGKQPFRIMLKSGEPFAMAGIYACTDTDRYEAAEKGPVNFAIVTKNANDAVSRINDRMPVILKPGKERNGCTPVERDSSIPSPPNSSPPTRHPKNEPRLIQLPRNHHAARVDHDRVSDFLAVPDRDRALVFVRIPFVCFYLIRGLYEVSASIIQTEYSRLP